RGHRHPSEAVGSPWRRLGATRRTLAPPTACVPCEWSCRSGPPPTVAGWKGPRRARAGSAVMKVMVLVKASEATEAGRMPSAEELRAMGEYNEQLVAAGIMRGGDGLYASARGRRVRFD